MVAVGWYIIMVHVLALVELWFLKVNASGLVLSFGRSLSRGLQGWGARPKSCVDLDAMARRRSSSTGVESSGEQRDSASVAHRRSSSTVVESSGEQRDSASVVSSQGSFSEVRQRTGVGEPAEGSGCDEKARVVRDTLALLPVGELREALREEGLPVSGLKGDLVNRLSSVFLESGTGQQWQEIDKPSVKQLRYVLWIIKCVSSARIRYSILKTRTATSEWIACNKPE